MPEDARTALVDEALDLLGIRRLLLSIHDASFPSAPEEEIGRGSPYGRGAQEFLRFVRGLGFDGLQVGPQGETTFVNPSPYDGALFTHSVLSLAPLPLFDEPPWACLGDAAALVAPFRPAEGPTTRVQYGHAFWAARGILRKIGRRIRRAGAEAAPLREAFAAFRSAEAAWLQPDALYEALAVEHGTDDWRRWPAIDRGLYCPAGGEEAAAAASRRASLAARHAETMELHDLGQWILELQQDRMRQEARRLGLELYGDLQIGVSQRDLWSRRGLFLPGYLLGAPPSRTNPEGQPWGFPVLDPRLVFVTGEGGVRRPGPVLEFFRLRIGRVFLHFDGVRIDHPHGIVCPWVYRADDPDPYHAVQTGARLFSSPHLPDHPELAPFAIPRREQIADGPDDGAGRARWADDWVRELEPAQVEKYAVLFDAIIDETRAKGRRKEDVMAEVLSTYPRQLRVVMDRHGLGRFRITQKADLTKPDDPYRSENARPADWIMVGNHDTRPLWLLADCWHETGATAARAAHLATRLVCEPERREAFARWAAADPRHLCQAMFAELFASPAAHVQVFFADLFGMREIYNQPGTVSADNWTLRVPRAFRACYAERLRDGGAMNLPLALSLALSAKRPEPRGRAEEVAAALMREARGLSPGLELPG